MKEKFTSSVPGGVLRPDLREGSYGFAEKLLSEDELLALAVEAAGEVLQARCSLSLR